LKYRRIELAVKPEFTDPFATHVKWAVTKTLGYPVRDVRIVLVYTVYSDLSESQLEQFASDVLVDPVLSFYSVGSPVAKMLPPFTWAVEISFKTGVTDNVGHTARDVLGMMSGNLHRDNGTRVYKSTQYLMDAPLDRKEVQNIGDEILHNGLIEDVEILSYDDFMNRGGFAVREKHFDEGHTPRSELIDLDIPDRALVALSEKRVLALTLDEMKYFKSYFSRPDVFKKRTAIGISASIKYSMPL
jgi:phosphoribosylformylglycinamidine (FGAM) synthase PurS component